MAVNPYLNERERRILEAARVGIAGAGGLGSNCAMHLVRAGVRHLVLADFDRVAASNLNRQFFFRDQIGEKKVEALAENLLRIDPDLDLELHDLRLDSANLAGIFTACSIVAEAFDRAEAKAMLLSTLLPLGMPVVAVSGIAGFGRSSAVGIREIGRKLVMIGDGTSGVDGELFPSSPRVGIAAAMQANTVIARLLNIDI